MSERVQSNHPRQYSISRLKQFYMNAAHVANIGKELKPDSKTINRVAYSDAIIGQYLDKVDKELSSEGPADESDMSRDERLRLRNLALTKVVWCLEFLEGADLAELQKQISEFDAPELEGEQPRDVILSVAREGANFARERFEEPASSQSQQPPSDVKNKKQAKKTVVPNEIIQPSVEEFTNLEDVILSMCGGSEQKGRITPGTASALLMLFELRAPTASLEAQKKHYEMITRDVMRHIRTANMTQAHAEGRIADRTLEKGMKYVNFIARVPFDVRRRVSPIGELERQILAERLTEGSSDQDLASHKKQIREDVLGHIGYFLDKLY